MIGEMDDASLPARAVSRAAQDRYETFERLIQPLIDTAFALAVAMLHDREAVEAAAEFRPDVAVLDLAMPKLNGYEAARLIREQPWGKRIYLIALSGWGHHMDRQRSKEAGFDEHLTKPAKYETLAEVLDRLSADDSPELPGQREL